MRLARSVSVDTLSALGVTQGGGCYYGSPFTARETEAPLNRSRQPELDCCSPVKPQLMP